MGVSSWGGATDYINEAIERRKEEERREALRQAMERAQQERPRPAPEPLPNPWQRPVFSRPDIAVAQPPEPMQLSRPQVDTGTPMLGGGLSSPTVTSRVEQPQPQARPGQIAPRPMMQSLADRFNGPQPQQQSPWQPPSLTTPPQPQRATPDILRGEYNAPNRPMIPVPPRPMIGGQVEDKSLIAPERSAMGDAWQQYRNTPEYKYAQQKSQDRQGYTPPTFGEALENRTGEDDPYLSDYGVVGLSQALNRFPPTRELISRGQDMLQHVFEVPQMAALNAPIFGGSSASEVITADAKTLMEFLAMTTLGKKYQPQGEQGIPAYLDQVRTQQLQRTRNERGAVAAAAETNPAAILALRNLPSDTVTPTLDMITNRDKYVADLKQEAAAIMAGDPVKAGELFLKAQELEGMSYAEMVDQNMNPVAEIAYGMLDASDLVIPPIAGLFKLLPEMRALQKARKIINISEGAALANLAGATQRGAKLTEAVAAGNKAARQVYSEIIAPFQGTGEKLATNKYLRWTLTQATDASRAAQDTKILHDGLVGVVGGFTSKADVMMILDNAINAPQDLVKGIVGLSEAPNDAVRWGRGLVANTPYAARQPILKTVENELLGMRALQGPGLVNPVEFQAELDGIISTAARRMHGGKQPKTLPFGAQEAAIEITGANRGRVVYKDAKGNILQAGAETTVPNAQRQLDGILKDQSGKLQLHQVPYQIIKTFADVQKYIMNDVWLFGRPANWAGNALGASVMLYANDAYTPLPLRDIQNWTSMVYGGYQPSQRLANTLPNVTTSTRTMKDEVGGSAIGWLASKVTGTPDNKITQTMKKLEEIPYGTTEIQLPGGQAIPVGEEAFAARAWYVPAKRVRDGELATSVTNDLGPRFEAIESISPEWVESAKAKVLSLAQTGSKQDVMNGMRSWIGKPTITNTLQELGVPPELLLPHQAREIEQLLMDASPSQAGEVSQRLTEIFHDARVAPASSLTIDPGQVNVHWTDADMAQEAAWIADGQVEDALRAGMDEATARTQAVEVTTGWLKEQQQTFERVLQDYAPVATNPQALGAVMDFYLDFMTAKGKVRKFVDELGQNARNVNTPEAWQGKWTATNNVYGSLRDELGKMAEQARLNLQAIYNGEQYTPRYDWWETTKSYLNWDEEAFHAMRTTDLGGIEDDAAKWQQVISGNREMFDNSQYELLGAFQAYPTLEGFDVVRSGLRRAETEGARIASELAILRRQRATGALSATEYNRIRNAKWNQYFDDAAELNGTLGKVIIRNGLAKQTLSELKWTENGQTWELLGPSGTPNKWRARNTASNEAQEFTVGAADEANPFVVPKNVVDDYNRLAGNEVELDKAAEVAMQEIADNAPAVRRQVGYGDDYRNTRGIGPSPSDTPTIEPVPPPTWREPDTEQGLPGYNSAGQRTAEPLPQDIPTAGEMPPRAEGYERGEIVSPLLSPPDDVEFMPNVKLPEVPSTPIPTNDDIRRIASESGIATATKQGKPTDKHLLASLNKRTGIKVANLDDMTDVQRLGAVDALKARGEEVISKMSPAEAQKAVATTPSTPTSPVTREEYYGEMRLNADRKKAELRRNVEAALTPEIEAKLKEWGFIKGDEDVFGAIERILSQRSSWNKDTGGKVQGTGWQALSDSKLFGDSPNAKRVRGPIREYARGIRNRFGMDDEMAARPSYDEFIKAATPTPPPSTVGTGNAPTVASTPTTSGKRRPLTPEESQRMRELGDDIDNGGWFTEAEFRGADELTPEQQQRAAEIDAAIAQQNRGRTNKLGTSVSAKDQKRIDRNIEELRSEKQSLGKSRRPLTFDEQLEQYERANRGISWGSKFDRKEAIAEYLTLRAQSEGRAIPKQIANDFPEIVAKHTGSTPSTPTMKEYDFAVPSASHMFGMEDKGDGYNVFKRMFSTGKRAGNNTPPQVADVARVTIENLNDVERTLKSRLPEILMGKPNSLTGAQKLAALDAVNDWLPNIDQINTISRMVGDEMASHMMLNVNNRKDFDTLLSLMFPYHYFWSRMPSRLVTAALQKPSLVNFFYESKRAIDLENQQAGVPDRLAGTVGIPGTNARINISAPLFRYMMGGAAAYLTPNPYVKDDPTDNQAEKIIKGWERNGGPGVNLWLKFAADMADGKLDKNYSSTLNDLVPIPLVGAKASSVYQALSGQMPSKTGWAAKMGFGSSTTPDGFGLDTYGARRALGWIAEEEGIGDDLLGYANQVILNQYNGDPAEKDIDPAMLDEAMALAERGIKRNAQDAITGQVTGYTTTMAVKPWTEAEKAQTQASAVYNAAGYDPTTNPQGSKELQKAIIDANPSTTRGWAKSKDDPGIDAQISALYAEAEATGNWDVVMPKIEALKAQKTVDPTAPPADPTRGMNPTEVIAAEQKATAQTHWDAYMALEDNAEKAAYLRDNPDFAEIYKQNIIDKGETPEDWWTNYGGKGTGKGGTALGGGVGPEPGSVVRADFTEAQLDQYYEEYLGFNDSKDWDGQKVWLLEHPDFARLEADRKYNKDGEYPWWYDDVLGGSGVQGAAGLQRPPSQPNSVADVLRRPYDAPGTGDNKGASGLGKTGKGGGAGTSVEADWSTEWDEYKELGEDWAAKKQYMLDHPEFADYYKERYGSAWWLEDNSSSTYNRAYYGGGGGGGGGSPYLGGSSTSYHNARVDPRFMDRGLWEGPQMRPTIPYFNSNPEWLQSGRDLRPDRIEKWRRPQW